MNLITALNHEEHGVHGKQNCCAQFFTRWMKWFIHNIDLSQCAPCPPWLIAFRISAST